MDDAIKDFLELEPKEQQKALYYISLLRGIPRETVTLSDNEKADVKKYFKQTKGATKNENKV